MKTLIKKYWWGILILLVGIAWLVVPRQRVPLDTTLPIGPQWNSLSPGASTKEDFKNKLGNPIREAKSGDYLRLEYKSPSPAKNHVVFFQEEIAILIKEVIPPESKTNVTNMKAAYGESSSILYGEDSVNGFNLYVYPEKGVAYVGNPEADVLLEVWYFTPVESLKEFNSRFATDYSSTIKSQF